MLIESNDLWLTGRVPILARVRSERHDGAMGVQRSWLQQFVYDLSRIAVRVVGWLFFRLKLAGIQKFPEEGGALVCSNHQSYFDPLLLGALCDRRMNYLARENLFRSKVFGGLIRFYDAIPVKRDGMSISGLKQTLQRLKGGELVVIFPEGTRTSDGEIAALKSGFCILARKAKVPLVPVAISGAFDVWPKRKRLPKLARISLCAAEPIPAKTVAELDDESLVSLVEHRIRECFAEAEKLRSSLAGPWRVLFWFTLLPGLLGAAIGFPVWWLAGGGGASGGAADNLHMICTGIGCLVTVSVAIYLAVRFSHRRFMSIALCLVWILASLWFAIDTTEFAGEGLW